MNPDHLTRSVRQALFARLWKVWVGSGIDGLGVYVKWRRQQREDIDKFLDEHFIPPTP